jgi:hypothetical protein
MRERWASALDLNNSCSWTRNYKRFGDRTSFCSLARLDRPHAQLVGFLRDRNPAVRQIALETLLGHTPKESPSRSLFLLGLPKEPDAIRDLKILCRDQLVCTVS